MKIFKKPIFTGFAPNINPRDIKTALCFLLCPWKWNRLKKGKCRRRVLEALKKYFHIKHVFFFDSGRSALYYALKSIGIEKGDQVLVQAYTCVVVTNAIRWTGATPVYVDINNDFNMNIADAGSKITNKSKAIIVQHTFGLPADIERLKKLAKDNNLKLIEDCAHSLGAKYGKKLTGTMGDIGMFSFGSDKIISCVRGGALITRDDQIADKLMQYTKELPEPNTGKIVQHLLQIPVFVIGRALYNIKVGKWILYLTKKLNVVNKIIYSQEKLGRQVHFYPAKLANALACILISQIKNIDKWNQHRRSIASYYRANIFNPRLTLPSEDERHVYLRFTILADNSDKIREQAFRRGIILGNWYNCAIVPCDIDLEKTGYVEGECPNAEKLAAKSLNLPTDKNIKLKQAQRIVDMLNKAG